MLLRCLWVNFRQHYLEFSSLIQSYKHLEFCSEISLSSLKKPHFVDQTQCEYHYALVSQKCQFWASAGICFGFYLFLCFFKEFFFFVLMWIIFKVFIEFATILLLFLYVLGFFCFYLFIFFWLQGMQELSSQTRDRTYILCFERQSLSPWTTREVPEICFVLPFLKCMSMSNMSHMFIIFLKGIKLKIYSQNHISCYLVIKEKETKADFCYTCQIIFNKTIKSQR